VATAIEAEPRTPVWAAVRPERLRLARELASASDENSLAGKIVEIGYLGDLSMVQVALADGTRVKASVTNSGGSAQARFAVGEAVILTFPPEAAIVLTQ
jgi:putrescine transport system ATP-binding protein